MLFLFITLTYMTRTRLLFVFMAFILFFSACNDKTEPKFYYIENNSDEEVTVYNSSINITVGAKSNKKIDTVSELQYSLKRNKTIAEFTDSSKNINADIDYLSSTLEEGFVDGGYCYILKFKNSFTSDSKYAYSFYNSREQDVTIKYSTFGTTESFTVSGGAEVECSFKYKTPELNYFIGEHKISPNHSEEEDGKVSVTL